MLRQPMLRQPIPQGVMSCEGDRICNAGSVGDLDEKIPFGEGTLLADQLIDPALLGNRI